MLGADAPFALDGRRVDPATCEVEGPDGVQKIGPKAMEVLCFLASEPDRVRSRDEILAAVWPDTVISEEVLTTAVWELRRAFGDSARSPQFIRTVPRRGYTLMGLVTPLDTVSDGIHTLRRPLWRRRIAVLAAAVALTAAVAGGWLWMTRPAEVRVESVAVLPVVALSEDPNDRHLAVAITDTLITDLAQLEGVRVVSRTTAAAYGETSLSVPEIARELGVDAVVEGTLARSEHRVVLNVQLIHGATDAHLWAETYERPLRDLSRVQVELARSVAAAMSEQLGPQREPTSTPSSNQSGSQLVWRLQTGGEVWSTPVVDGALVHVGSRDGFLYTVDLATGAEQWRYRATGEVMAAPLAVSGRVIVVSTGGVVVALQQSSGEELWRRRLGASIEADPSSAAGVLFIGDRAGGLVALSVVSGEELWRRQLDGSVSSRTVVDEKTDLVLVATDVGTLVALDQTDGTVRWQVASDGLILSSPAVSGETVLATSLDHHVYALDITTGDELWRREVPFGGTTPRPWRDRAVVAAIDGSVRAVDVATGDQLWQFDTSNEVIVRPQVARELVLVGSLDRWLYALDVWNGQLRWRTEIGSWVTTSAAVADGKVVVGAVDGAVRCLRLLEPAAMPLVSRPEDGYVPQPQQHGVAPPAAEVIVMDATARGPELVWRIELDGPLGVPASVIGDMVVVGGLENVYGIDVASGVERWRFPLSGEAGTRPVPAENVVLVGSRDGAVYALEPATGAEAWRFATDGGVTSAAAVIDGVVVFGSRDRHVYAVDVRTGAERWRRAVGGEVRAGVAAADDTVFVGCTDDQLYALSLRDGTRQWQFDAGDWVVAEPVVDETSVYVGAADGTFYAVDRTTGVERWRAQTGGEIWYRPALAGGLVFFGSADYYLYAIDVDSGDEQWRLRTGNRALSTVVEAAGVVYCGSHDGNLYAVRSGDGEVLWQLGTGGAVVAPTVVGSRLVVGSHDRHLHLLELDPPG